MRSSEAAKRMLDGEQHAAKQLATDSLVRSGDAYNADDTLNSGYVRVAAGRLLHGGDMELPDS